MSTVVGDMILEHGRPKVHHEHLEKSKYRYMWYYWMIRLFGKYFIPMILSIISFAFIPWTYSVAFYLVSCGYVYYSINNILNRLLSRADGHPHIFHDQPDLKQLPTYQDERLIWSAYSTSPYRVTLLRCAFEKGLITEPVYKQAISAIDARRELIHKDITSVGALPPLEPVGEFDRVDSLMMFQPCEGFCGGGTINTMLLSIYGVPITKFTRMPEPMGMDDLKKKLAPYLPPNNTPLKDATLYHCDNNASYEEFLEKVLQTNDPSKRIVVNFLRAPLFNPRPSNRFYRAVALLGGHWSPIASVIYDDKTKDYYCLILDVNESYGAWMVSVKQLYMSCHTRDESRYRGIVIVDVDTNETQ